MGPGEPLATRLFNGEQLFRVYSSTHMVAERSQINSLQTLRAAPAWSSPPLQAWARDEHPLGQLLSRALQPGENTPRSMPRRQGAKPFVNGDKICESTLSIKEGAAGQAHRPAQNASRAWEGTAILNTKLIPPPLLVIIHTSPISKKKSWEVVTKSPKNLTHLPHAMHLPWARLLHSLRLAPHQTPEALCPNS